MNLNERLNVLIQAATLSQKGGVLTLDEAVKAKSAIDMISSGALNQDYISAINILIEIAVASQKKGVYSLKDAHMIYIAVEGMENDLQNEMNKINTIQTPQVANQNVNENSNESVVSIPPKKIKRNS